jgi:hypothetical protein
VARRAARLHAPGEVDGAAVEQQLLGERRLARVGWLMMANVRRRAPSRATASARASGESAASGAAGAVMAASEVGTRAADGPVPPAVRRACAKCNRGAEFGAPPRGERSGWGGCVVVEAVERSAWSVQRSGRCARRAPTTRCNAPR